ncbi:MAG: tRNA (N6-isopentenyl adenosine(37)-C2)-methylthiotransferase MiaB [Dehalococcoidia bacterium]
MTTAITDNGVPHSYYIWTIGCQMNQADSARLAGALEQLGLQPAGRMKEADVVVLNSCVVRQSAEDKVVGTLGLVKPLKQQRPDRIVALMGCMVGPRTDELQRRFLQVDLFMRPQQYRPLLDLLGGRLGLNWEGCLDTLLPPKPGVICHIPIIHGCDLMCTFCIIPYRRGRQVSRPIPEVVREVKLLTERGVREVTLLGQTVDAYGYDLPERPDLADLFYELNHLPGLARIRFLTSHPNFMSDRVIQAVAELDKVCEHINLPVQAGDDQMLEAMRRRYHVDDYRQLVRRIRQAIPQVALSTDIIVGFCGETAEQFQRTVEVLEETRFDKVHLAVYSPRPSTFAWRKMEDDVPQVEKERRLQTLEQLQERIAAEINQTYLGETVEVLVDSHHRGKWQGRTRTDKLLFFEDEHDRLGQLVQVKVTRTSPWALQGVPADRAAAQHKQERA